MRDNEKTKDQLIKELNDLRWRVVEQEKSETESKRTEEALYQAKEEWERTFDSVPDLIAILNNQHRIVRANKAMADRVCRSPAACVGLICYEQVHGTDAPPAFCPHTMTLTDGQEHVWEMHEDHLGGDFLVTTTPVFDAQGGLIETVHVARDITDRKQTEDALKALILKDDLTGLYNRRGFFTLAEQGLKMAQRNGTEMLLIYGDLDNLKRINDAFGHKEGDQALKDMSHILKNTFRESDIIARMGGDEFVLLTMNSIEDSSEKLITRLDKAVNDLHLKRPCSYTLSMSLGIVCFDPQTPCSLDDLLAQADKMMYENKQKRQTKSR